jgi:biopolymer transport protein TolR
MALSIHDPFQAGRRGRRARRGQLSEINVTPLVDVMLVLLIIFMISAPLLTVGVPLQLPKTEAGAMQDQTEPLTVSVRSNGDVFLNDSQVPFSALSPALRQMTEAGFKKPIYVRADGRAPYAVVATST